MGGRLGSQQGIWLRPAPMPLQVSCSNHAALSCARVPVRLQAAIEALKKYLDVYANDKDAWEEMADLYLQVKGLAVDRVDRAGLTDG